MNRHNIYEQLKIDEGVKYEIYNDHLGLPTTGVGHLILESDEEYGKPLGTCISEDRAFDLFEQDLDNAIIESINLYGPTTFNSFPDEVQEIVINMMFNMGRTRLSKFKNFKAALEHKEWNIAANEMVDSKWHKQVTNRANRLVERMRNV